jgi:predicted permease
VLTSLAPLVRGSALGLAALVLLIACMNVANLLFVRATARQRELAVRAALGCGRGRLIQLLLLESAFLGVAGTAAGLVLARWATDLFMASVTPSFELPLNLHTEFDWRVFVYAGAVATATGLLVGVLPALRASRPRVTGVLHDGGYGASTGGSRIRMRNVLVVAQVAGSLILLVVAGLFVRSLQRAQFVDLAFEPRGLLTVRLNPRQVGYSTARTAQFYDELDDRLARLPGVESVSMATTLPLGYVFESTFVAREEDAPTSDEPQRLIGYNSVTPPYFDTMRLPMAAGRAFAESDTEDSRPVVIVNETMARQFWPGADPIGRRVRAPRIGGDALFEVIGVARDSKYLAVFEGPTPHMYSAMAQVPTSWRMIQVRTSAAPETLGPLVEREIQSLDPDMPVADLRTMTQALEGGAGVLMFRIGATQAAAMGLLGLLLAIVGVYGVVSYGASQRTREMGIRIALGAEPWRVRSLVMRQGIVLVAAGLACGIAAAAVVTRLIGRFFVLVGAGDPMTFLTVTVLLTAIAMVACYLPARRAMRVDPMTALRHD